MNSEKVKELKKALECCANWNGQSRCKDCPIGIEKCYEDENLMPRLALTLINELEKANNTKYDAMVALFKEQELYKKRNEKLKDRIAKLEKENATLISNNADGGASCHLCMKYHQKHALKQFAERLKGKLGSVDLIRGWTVKIFIDETLKEFIDDFPLCEGWQSPEDCKTCCNTDCNNYIGARK